GIGETRSAGPPERRKTDPTPSTAVHSVAAASPAASCERGSTSPWASSAGRHDGWKGLSTQAGSARRARKQAREAPENPGCRVHTRDPALQGPFGRSRPDDADSGAHLTATLFARYFVFPTAGNPLVSQVPSRLRCFVLFVSLW